MSEPKKSEAKSKPNLDGYVEVHDRIEAFYEKYPEGSLQSKWDMLEIGGAPVIVVEAKAYRTAQDTRPGIGLASEPVPGRTPYTKDSELMNAETSAWGRALAALGFKVKSGIATGNEVRARQNSGEKRHAPSPKQLDFFQSLAEKCGFSESTDPQLGQVMAYASRNLTGGKGGSMSQLIDQLKGPDSTERADDLGHAVKEWAAKQSDLPAPDTEGLPSEEPAEEALPF